MVDPEDILKTLRNLNDELTGFDYLTKPVVELCTHPDYNSEVMGKVHRIVQMTSAQLEDIKIGGDDSC